jgi:hypothetical protein
MPSSSSPRNFYPLIILHKILYPLIILHKILDPASRAIKSCNFLLFYKSNSIESNASYMEMIYYDKAAIQVFGFVQKFHKKYNIRTLKGN